jgi:dolichol-phosphate mannosyltransferase
MVTRRTDAMDVVALAVRLGTLAGTRRSYRTVGPVYWLSPLADPLAAVALGRGIARRTSTWRGRRYA